MNVAKNDFCGRIFLLVYQGGVVVNAKLQKKSDNRVIFSPRCSNEGFLWRYCIIIAIFALVYVAATTRFCGMWGAVGGNPTDNQTHKTC